MATQPKPRDLDRVGLSRELLQSTSFLLKRLGMDAKERSLAAFAGTELSPQHYGVLSLLDEGTRETQATIADALRYDRSHLVGLLDELEAKQLIERRRDTADRRRHVVSLTASGEQKLAELRTIVRRVEKDFLAPLDAEERRRLHELLAVLAAHHDPRCAGVSAAAGD